MRLCVQVVTSRRRKERRGGKGRGGEGRGGEGRGGEGRGGEGRGGEGRGGEGRGEGGYLPPSLGLNQLIWHASIFDGGNNSIYQHQDQEYLLNDSEVPPVQLLCEDIA